MITGHSSDGLPPSPLKAGVDDFLPRPTPERNSSDPEVPGEGHLVAMAGDGTNDPPPSPKPTSRSP